VLTFWNVRDTGYIEHVGWVMLYRQTKFNLFGINIYINKSFHSYASESTILDLFWQLLSLDESLLDPASLS
jgi:hypothetical protein